MTDTRYFELLASGFIQEEVTTCFALLGDANMNWATALAGKGCQMIYLRHEHCAVSAAMSWSRTMGKPGIASVTCGPGVTQILTALPAAVRAAIPLVIFAGEAPLKSAWYNQSIDQAPLITATGAAYIPLHHAERMTMQVRDAFVQARVESRPVVLGVPFDLQNVNLPSAALLPVPSVDMLPDLPPEVPNSQSVGKAVELVQASGKIIVMAGLGAVRAGAGDACRELARVTGGLLATTLPARGLFHDDPFYLGVAGGFSSDVARACFAEAELIVAVGTSLARHNADGGSLFDSDRVLHIDVLPRVHSQGRVASSCQLKADACVGVEAMLEMLVDTPNSETSWRSAELASRIRDTPADGAVFEPEPGLHDPRDVVSALDSVIPKNWHVVNSSGHCSYYFAHMVGRPVDYFHTIREFGAIGNGLSYAIGVAVAHPETPVVLCDGDGSFLMHSQELETIKRLGLRILICVMNDGAYGSEIHKLRAEGLSDAGGVFGRFDLASVARGFKLEGHRVDELDRLSQMRDDFCKIDGAEIWDFPVSDKVVSPVIRRSHAKSSTV